MKRARNENQFTKLLMFELEDPDAPWEADGTDFWAWAKPVYRKPQQSWDSTEGFTRQKIWYTPKITPDETEPDVIEWPEWIQCYWDSQAGRWVVTEGGGGKAQIIQFSLVSDEYGADDAVPEKCSERISFENYRGEVVRVPCGGSRPVFGEDYEGIVDLRDELGFLDGRDFRALVGKLGFATLLKPDNDYEDCYWCIVSIDFHREVQVVTDIVFGEGTITIERANVKVWDDCKIDDEIIEGADCSDQYYTDGGGV